MALDAIIHRKEFSRWQQLQQVPWPTLASMLYAERQRLAQRHMAETGHEAGTDVDADDNIITVVCVSDTHNSQPSLPPGDVLIHAGDMTQGGTVSELQAQLDWIHKQPHTHKVVIAGNHDIVLDDAKAVEFGVSPAARRSLQWGSITYLQHSSVRLRVRGRSVSIFGHPSTRKHGNWAFQYEKGMDLFTRRVVDDVDILVSHSAPRFHLDLAGWGDEFLLQELWRTKPKLHVFGHIHGGYGQDMLFYDHFELLYERVRYGNAGLLTLFHMALLLLQMFLTGPKHDLQRTILVNSSAVDGLADRPCRVVQSIKLNCG